MNAELKPFQQVLVRDSERGTWEASFYSHGNITMHGNRLQIIPYEGNEHLLGTTDSPKLKRWRAEKNEGYYFVNSFLQVDMCCDVYNGDDDKSYEIGNYFRTKEEAEAMADRFKAMLKGE